MTLPFLTKLNELDPAFRVGGEAQHTIRQALIVRWLDRCGLPASAAMDMDGAEYAEMFDRAQRVAARYLRAFGPWVRGYAPDLQEAGAVIDGEAVRVEVRSVAGFVRQVRVWVQGAEVGVSAWGLRVRAFVDAVRADVFESMASQRAQYGGPRGWPMQSSGVR